MINAEDHSKWKRLINVLRHWKWCQSLTVSEHWLPAHLSWHDVCAEQLWAAAEFVVIEWCYCLNWCETGGTAVILSMTKRWLYWCGRSNPVCLEHLRLLTTMYPNATVELTPKPTCRMPMNCRSWPPVRSVLMSESATGNMCLCLCPRLMCWWHLGPRHLATLPSRRRPLSLALCHRQHLQRLQHCRSGEAGVVVAITNDV